MGILYSFLSPTEKKVINLLMKGLTNQKIGDELCLSKGTIDAHINSIYSKYDVENPKRVNLVLKRLKEIENENTNTL